MATFISWILSGIYDLLIQVEGMEAETDALYNTLVISVTATIISICVGAVVQSFFNFFGALFNFPKVKKK